MMGVGQGTLGLPELLANWSFTHSSLSSFWVKQEVNWVLGPLLPYKIHQG
jgi:hypothetical protein